MMEQTRTKQLSSGEIAVYVRSTGDLFIFPGNVAAKWTGGGSDIAELRNIVQSGNGMALSNKDVRTLAEAFSSVVLLGKAD